MALLRLFILAELLGAWPQAVGVVVVALIPKADGGRRPIGLLPSVIRWWMKIWLDVVRKALKELRPCREVLRNYRKDGTLFYNELSLTPVLDESDELVYFIGVQKDVSERVANLAEIDRLRDGADSA